VDRQGVERLLDLKRQESNCARSRAGLLAAGWRFSAQVILALTFLASLASGQAQDGAKPLIVWEFDHSLVNPLGGTYSVFQGGPSWARTYLEPSSRERLPNHSLRITAHREAKGFCGVWFNFYSARELTEQYLDASGYRYLSFRVKGAKGGEDFDITLEDSTWRQHEDSNPTRPLGAYLAGGAPTAWREVLIPLSDFAGLDTSKLFNLIFVFSKEGDYRLEVDDIGFTNRPARPLDPQSSPSAGSGFPLMSARGLWVWNTNELLDPANASQLDNFFGFCAAQSITEIFLSVDFQKAAGEAAPGMDLKAPEGLRSFLARAHAVGMKVEALAGTPEWAVNEHHAEALAAIDAVAAFNTASSAPARFDGIHFDVEPYSLVGYADPGFRPELLKEFLELTEKCRDRARSEGGLEFRCDVPGWFYTDNQPAREELLVDFHGATKTVGEHLTDLLDSVTIMDYRNEADGAGGIILSGVPSLKYAAAQGKKIQVGLETSVEPDSTIYFVCGLPLNEFQKRLANSRLRDELYQEHYRLATLSDGANIHVGLTAPEVFEGDTRADFENALAKLALELGASSDPKRFPPDPILAQARRALRDDPELSGFDPFNLQDPASGRNVVGFKTLRHMLPAITFHGLSREVFDEETRSAIEWLSPYSSFQGLAIHHYGSFREMTEGK
jgi:hypothetical protein